MTSFAFDCLALANPAARQCSASIRQTPSDFQVDEKLPFEPSGEGTHAFLLIEKTGSNTDWVARQLALFAGVNEVAIGYAGLKDRHAVTTQWFSVNLEGHQEPDWSQFDADNCVIKQVSRHNKKLKRGVLSGNHFTLKLTDIKGDAARWQQSLENIQTQGVPNYFAAQRFGRDFANLERADAWFSGSYKPKKRQQRSLLLSAARSWLFNLVLSARISQGSWQQGLGGDVMQLAGSGSVFVAEQIDKTMQARLESFDVHPTGPLWGRGALQSQAACLALESECLQDWSDWRLGLEQAGLKQERRALRVKPAEMSWQLTHDTLSLSFFLPAGSYATAVLRELAVTADVSLRNSLEHPVSQ